MKKTLLAFILLAGIGSVSAASTATWEFSLSSPQEQFDVGSGLILDGWTISSQSNSTDTYVGWANKPNNDRDISTQTVGMWLNLSSLQSQSMIYSFGSSTNLQGLRLFYNADGSFTYKRTGESGQTFSVSQDVINSGWFNLTMTLETTASGRKTNVQVFVNGEEYGDSFQLDSALNGGQNGGVSVGGSTSASNSFQIADFKAYKDSVLTGEQIKEAWGMGVVPEPATASLSLLGLAALMMRRRRN